MTIEQDYIDLFSFKRKGHMGKYIYMYRPEAYEDVLKDKNYYPFQMEVDLLNKKAQKIVSEFKEIEEVIEIGPGSYTSMFYKTVPFLHALNEQSPLLEYKPIDFSLEYAQHACDNIKKDFPNIKTTPLVGDFLRPDLFKSIEMISKKKRLFFGFGQPIFANNNDRDCDIILSNLTSLMKKDDYFLFSLDTSRNKESLEKAYNTQAIQDLLLNMTYYLKDTLHLKGFDPRAFKLSYFWDNQQTEVKLALEPTESQTFKINGNVLSIQKKQIFDILISRKLDFLEVEKILLKHRIMIKNIITLKEEGNPFVIIIAQKQ